jgi:uncharacterized protein (TIGR02301 family)
MALVCALAAAGPASAQSFFERLFGPPRGAAPAPEYRPPPQYRPPAAAPQQRRPGTATPGGRPSGAAPAAPGAPAPAAANAPEPPPPPYEKELRRMAEIIGSVAFLRSLCTGPDAAEWPQRMQQLLEAEGTTPGRKERLAGAYNKGFQAFAVTYRVCTPSATEATSRYLREGDQIARGLAGRYGG